MSKLALQGGDPVRTVPFPTWPIWGDEEVENLKTVVNSGKWGRLHGPTTEAFERKFADMHCARYGLCINSGTTGLQLALMAANVPTGSEVICPAYTFIATASAILDVGCIPVFVDVEEESFNIDPQKVEEAITPRTGAIMPVHFAGRPANMDAILDIAKKHNLKVIEDAAQAWGAKWNGKPVGALGDAGMFSFQSSKNINSGEGGIVLTNDDRVAKFLLSHHNCGRSDDGLWYEHFYYGGNYRLTEFQAAILHAQFDRYPEQHKTRMENLNWLNEHLGQIDGISVASTDSRVSAHACHLYVFRYHRDRFHDAPREHFIEALRKEGVPCSPGYSMPLYEQPVFRNKSFGPRGKTVDLPIDYNEFDCPVSNRLCKEEAVWFGQSVLLGSRDDMQDIATAIQKIKDNASELTA